MHYTSGRVTPRLLISSSFVMLFLFAVASVYVTQNVDVSADTVPTSSAPQTSTSEPATLQSGETETPAPESSDDSTTESTESPDSSSSESSASSEPDSQASEPATADTNAPVVTTTTDTSQSSDTHVQPQAKKVTPVDNSVPTEIGEYVNEEQSAPESTGSKADVATESTAITIEALAARLASGKKQSNVNQIVTLARNNSTLSRTSLEGMLLAVPDQPAFSGGIVGIVQSIIYVLNSSLMLY